MSNKDKQQRRAQRRAEQALRNARITEALSKRNEVYWVSGGEDRFIAEYRKGKGTPIADGEVWWDDEDGWKATRRKGHHKPEHADFDEIIPAMRWVARWMMGREKKEK